MAYEFIRDNIINVWNDVMQSHPMLALAVWLSILLWVIFYLGD